MAKIQLKSTERPKTISNSISKSRTEKSYRKIVTIFIVATIILIILICYFSFSKTIITITPNEEKIDNSFIIEIKKNPSNEEIEKELIPGRLIESILEDSYDFRDLTIQTTIEARAEGKVTIINNWSKAQPLMATTRLLSDEGVLFRTKERVDVPAGGKVEVEVEADQAGVSGNILPSHFTIPGLWPGLQDKIYGESYEEMTGGTKEAKVATEADINQAKEELRETLYDKGEATIETSLAQETQSQAEETKVFIKQILAEESSVESNTETDFFTINTKMRVIAVVFEQSGLNNLAETKLKAKIPADKELINFDPSQIKYTVENYNLDNQTAKVRVYTEAKMVIKISSNIFNRENIINKDKQDIRAYFANFKEIKAVKIKFSPFWVVRAPTLKDHIEIRIQK